LLLAPEEETGFMMALLRMLAFIPDDGQSGSSNKLSQPQATAAAVPTPGVVPKVLPKDELATPINVPEGRSASSPIKLSVESWREMVKQLQLKGLEGQFALQTELHSFQDRSGTMMMTLNTNLPQIATAVSIQKVTQALEAYLHMPVKITIVSSDDANTVARIEAKDQAVAQVELEKTIKVDPFLEMLKEEIGVAVVEGSVRPLPVQKH